MTIGSLRTLCNVKAHEESVRFISTVHTGFTLCLPENSQEHFHLLYPSTKHRLRTLPRKRTLRVMKPLSKSAATDGSETEEEICTSLK